jgi:hypothetical protein
VRKTLKQIASEYGGVAVAVYLVIFALVLLGTWAAIHLGWNPRGVRGGVGTFTAAYLATKLTQPLRIAATLALTPVVARVLGRGPMPADTPEAGALAPEPESPPPGEEPHP